MLGGFTPVRSLGSGESCRLRRSSELGLRMVCQFRARYRKLIRSRLDMVYLNTDDQVRADDGSITKLHFYPLQYQPLFSTETGQNEICALKDAALVDLSVGPDSSM